METGMFARARTLWRSVPKVLPVVILPIAGAMQGSASRVSSIEAPGEIVQKRVATTKHLRAELTRDRRTNSDVLVLAIEPRDGWRIIAADDTLSGRPLTVRWEGADFLTVPAAGTPYVVAQDTSRVYEGRIEVAARVRMRPVIARIDYVACRKVCEPGWLSIRD